MKKVNNLNNKQHKMEKKLFRIIDRAQNRNNMKKYIVPQIQIVNLNIESALMGTSSADNVYNDVLDEGEFSNEAGWSSDNWSSCKD